MRRPTQVQVMSELQDNEFFQNKLSDEQVDLTVELSLLKNMTKFLNAESNNNETLKQVKTKRNTIQIDRFNMHSLTEIGRLKRMHSEAIESGI